MFLTNHTLTGAAIGLAVNPLLALPAGVISHLTLDAVPHFGYPGLDLTKNPGLSLAITDGLISLTTFLFIVSMFPGQAMPIVLGVFGATLPDLLYIPRYLFKYRPTNFFARFHKKIQWSETPLGIISEVAWAFLMVSLLFR